LPDAYTPVAGDPSLQTNVRLGGHLGDGAAVTAGNGHGQLELTKFHSPAATTAEPNAPANTLGLRRIMFAVDDIEDAVARLRAHGAELVGEVAQYEDSYRLCYVRGPAGIIVALAEQLRLKRDGDRPQSASSWATRSPFISMLLAQYLHLVSRHPSRAAVLIW
jgi:catechol 2,3-dioxygenase-like lactoylglutathione lyase family enzyme